MYVCIPLRLFCSFGTLSASILLLHALPDVASSPRRQEIHAYAYDEGNIPCFLSIPIFEMHIVQSCHNVLTRSRVYLRNTARCRVTDLPTRTSWSPTRRLPPLGGRLAASGPSETRWTTRGSTAAPNCGWDESICSRSWLCAPCQSQGYFFVSTHLCIMR